MANDFNILIVDDDSFEIQILVEMLKYDYSLMVAKCGKAAIHMAIKYIPDLILLDVLMPDMSGFDVITDLKNREETKNIPVIFITSSTGTSEEEKGLRLGAVDYITKPFSNTVVRARISIHVRIINQIRITEQIGMIDPLTKLPNRRAFDIRIHDEWHRAIRQKSPIGLIFADIDHFKMYNDTYGHLQGDKVITFVAQSIVSAIHRSSDMASRFGGEEFVVLLINTDLEGACIVAENIRKTVECGTIIFSEDGSPTSVTISSGCVSTIPTADGEMRAFIEKADQNMYAAKKNGRNRVECSI
ncbi:MAG: diguanylate cyclase [Treponema sp.]|jgi:diguanylate cyclase (GGDEF)-like protein|nr:diguanylate cyclase [Treponema sp.]